MKVLIVSASIGSGHIQAARAIEEYWQATYPEATITHVDFLSTDTLSFDNLLKETYIKMIDIFPMLYDLIYRLSQGERKGGVMQTVLAWILKSRMLRLINKEKPDVVIFTHPFPCGAACILKRQGLIATPLVAVLTDFTTHQFWIYPQVDLYCVPTLHMVKELETAHINSSRIKVTGIPVKRDFFKIPSQVNFLCDDSVKVLVMGGGLGLGSISRALQRLDEISHIDEFVVVAGRNPTLYEDLLALKGKLKTPTQVYGYSTEIPRLMSEATLLVTKPGALTCTEGVTMGLPMVFFNAIPGQEEANAYLMEKKGCGRWARDIHNLEDVVTALLINPQRLQQMHDTDLALRIDGARNTVNVIIDMLESEAHLKNMNITDIAKSES